MTCKDIFENMPRRFKPEGAAGWTSVIQFDLSGDGGGNWYLTVKDQTCTVDEGTAEAPSATVEISAENWVGVVDGSKNAMALFTTGQLKVKGNIGDIMKLQSPSVFARA